MDTNIVGALVVLLIGTVAVLLYIMKAILGTRIFLALVCGAIFCFIFLPLCLGAICAFLQ